MLLYGGDKGIKELEATSTISLVPFPGCCNSEPYSILIPTIHPILQPPNREEKTVIILQVFFLFPQTWFHKSHSLSTIRPT
jgi:hypothetical protein